MTTATQKDLGEIKADKSLLFLIKRAPWVASFVTAIFMAGGTFFMFRFTVVSGIDGNTKALVENAQKIEVNSTKIYAVEKWQTLRDGMEGFDAKEGGDLRLDMVRQGNQIRSDLMMEIGTLQKQNAAMIAILERIEKKP